jgi:hypothetical protein
MTFNHIATIVIMKKLLTTWFSLLLAVFFVAVWPSSARAAVFPVATNPAVVEFAGGAVALGTNYLVGYIAGTNLTGQLVSGTGQLIGASQVLGANPGFPPAAAVAGAKAGCLVTWSDGSIGSGQTMFGQLLATNGSLIGSKFPLLASVGAHGFQYVQAAASDGTNYLVVWQDAANTNFYGQWVTAAGSLSGAEFSLYSPGDGLDNRNMTVTFGRTNYLVVWQAGTNNSNNTYGELVAPGGGADSIFQLNTVASLEKNPVAAAFDGTNYLAVWSRATDYSSAGWPNWQMCGRLVSSSGAVLGNESVLVTEQATFPALAFDGDNYLLAWGYDTMTTNTDQTIHARFLDRSAGAIGPIFTPFPTEGSMPPMLPLNGILFDGTRYLLTATFGSFLLNGSGDVQGILGGDVYGKFISSSTQPPMFTQATVSGGVFQGQLKVVPGLSYTIEISTNLPTWTPVDVVSSDTTNVISLIDSRGTANFNQMFYRVVVGNVLPASYALSIHEFANAGGFGTGYTPAPSYPVSLNSYTMLFEVQNDFNLPTATNVFFTGPSGSGLTGAAGDPNNSSLNSSDAFYQSPGVTAPAAAPGGAWTVNYHATNLTFNVPDPQAAARLAIPLPTVIVSGDVIQSVNWAYHDATTGATLGGAPAYVTDLQVQIEGIVGGRIYNSPNLNSGVTSHTMTSSVNWSNVQTINMAYDDTLGNSYIIFFSKP